MAVSIVGILGLLIIGFIGLLVVTLLIVLGAKAIGGKQGSGGGLAVVGVMIVLLALFVGFALVGVLSPVVVRQAHVAKQDAAEHEINSFMATRDEQAAVELEGVSLTSELSASDTSDDQRASVTVAGNPWTDAVEEFQDFEADVYPSLDAAAEALGRRVGARLLETTTSSEDDVQSVYVWRDEGLEYIDRSVLEAVASGLRQKLDESAYVSIERPALKDDIVVNLAVQEIQFENHNRWRMKTESQSGAIALRVQLPGESFSVSTRFADAPWVEARTSFASSYANGDWLVGYSDGTHTSHDEARHDAIIAASDALLPLAQARINRLSASDQHRFAQQMQKDPNWLRNKVADELVSRNLATDRFAQRFDRPYGTVWREAVLVDASQPRVEEIARSLVQGLDSKISHDRATWFSFAAMLGLVFGTYMFLNMATKGYYAWTLRFAAAAGIVVVVFMVRALG